ITPGFDFYFIPMVLSSTEKKWAMDIQHEAIKEHKELIDWDETMMEGYFIMNHEAKAYEKTSCKMPSKEDVLAYAFMAEHMFHLPIFYLEYSSTLGDATLVRDVEKELDETLLFYGGGISNREEAEMMAEHADVIVVGNSVYTNFESALQTVKAVQ